MITYIRDSDPSIFSNNNADVDIYFVILYSVIFIGYILLRLKTAWGCYQDNDEVQAGPHAGKIFVQSKGYPLEKHLDSEQDREHQVDYLQNEFQLFIVLEVDVFKAQ